MKSDQEIRADLERSSPTFKTPRKIEVKLCLPCKTPSPPSLSSSYLHKPHGSSPPSPRRSPHLSGFKCSSCCLSRCPRTLFRFMRHRKKYIPLSASRHIPRVHTTRNDIASAGHCGYFYHIAFFCVINVIF